MRGVSSWLLARVMGRSFLIQGSWNYRTMIGTGMAFTLLPLLRYLYRDPEALESTLERHAGHFNAHPYLAGLALGSLVRLEEDGAPPELVRRFRSAVAGPLGALGDRVVWATWLPLSSLMALVAYQAGLTSWMAVVLFLVLYNAGHIALRLWGFRTGYRKGPSLASGLRASGLTARSRSAGNVVVGLAGVLTGLLMSSGTIPLVGVLASGAALVAGWVLGTRAWRPTALVVVVAVAALLLPELVA